MSITNILFISIALAMDAFAVSIVAGVTQGMLKLKNALLIALYFGFFQMMMPVGGWYLGSTFSRYIFPYQRIAAYLLLSSIGIKMIYESQEACSCKNRDYQCHYTLAALAVATSIDAFAAGLSFSISSTPLLPAIFIIGSTTFLLSLAGIYLGKLSSCLLHDYAEITGGIILLAIAFKILLFQ